MRHCGVSAKAIIASICARRKLTCCSYPDCHFVFAARRTLPAMSVWAAPWEASFLDGFGEGVGVHFEFRAEDVRHLKFVGEGACDAGELGGYGVVALEEEVVHLAVGEAVEEDGAGGQAVAAGAADLLVEGFDGGGQGVVDDGADVGLIDAHAEGDGGDDDLELAREELALDALARLGRRGRRGRRRRGTCGPVRWRALRLLCGEGA